MINNILITGVSGEIGQNLISDLSKNKNLKLIGLDKKSPPKEIVDKLHRFYKTNLLEFEKITKLIQLNKIRTVIHLGAILSTAAEKKPYLAHRVNVDATINLLNFASIYASNNNFKFKFIFPSSIAVYYLPSKNAKNKNPKIKEDDFLTPHTMYGINKLYCENMGIYYSNYVHEKSLVSNLDFRSLRFPGIISATTLPTGGTSDYAPEMTHTAAKGKTYNCFVHPNTTIPFMTMPDAINALKMLASAPGRKLKSKIYNVSGFSASAKEFEKEVKRYFPDSSVNYTVDKKRQQIVDSWPKDINDQSAKKDWKWKPQHTFQKAFKDYLIPAVKERYSL